MCQRREKVEKDGKKTRGLKEMVRRKDRRKESVGKIKVGNERKERVGKYKVENEGRKERIEKRR